MSESPKIVAVTPMAHVPGRPILEAGHDRMLVVLDMQIDYAMCREIGGEVDLCDPGFEAEVIAALARAGAATSGAAGIDELREQRDDLASQLESMRDLYYSARNELAGLRQIIKDDSYLP